MADIESGTCGICFKKQIPITRKYYYYDIKCECHSPNHFELVYHCEQCEPVEPKITKVIFNTNKLNKTD